MNFFLNGDFKIQESWQQRSNNSRNSKSRQRPKSRNNIKNNNSALYNAGKNILEPSYQPSTDLLDDQVTKKILKDFAAEIPPLPSSAKSQKKLPMNDIDSNKKGVGLPPKNQKNNLSAGDQSLVSSMASRLKQVEVTVKCQREEIKQKSQTIQKLRTQNEFLKGLRTDSSKVLKQMEDIKSQNSSLQKKIKEMQEYLKKYGVKWVGYNVEGKLDHQSLKNDIKKPKFNYRMPAQIQLGTIQRRVQELNAGLQAEGMGTEVYNQNGVHKFRKAEPLVMGFFGNGIAIKGFKFFPYKSKQSLQILSDLVDGYFPYVLKHKFPNGVFLSVVDKIAEKYHQNSSQNQQNVSNFKNFNSVQNKDLQPPSKQQFLNKLPKQVIKNGKVIEIRKAIQKKLNGEPESIPQEEEQLQNQVQNNEDGSMTFLSSCYKRLKENDVKEEEICTLKIRTEMGKVCVLHVQKQELMEGVYEWMDKVMGSKRYELMGNYPRRVYGREEKESLQELGLFPNAMLHVHLEQSKK